jgi:ketosteroid isomerase-like protein
MDPDMDQIARAFCSWRFPETYPYMADDITWTAIGREDFVGREAVIARCRQSMKFLEGVSGEVTKLETHRADSCVIVEGAARFEHPDGHVSRVASCDIFRFSEGRLVGITSYVIELDQP